MSKSSDASLPIRILTQRRKKLSDLVNFPVVLWSGCSVARNFPANPYPFRASSHFLYFAGLPFHNAAIRLEVGRLELYMDDPTPASILWHGASPTRDQWAEHIGADAAFPLDHLTSVNGAATIAVQDPVTRLQQAHLLDRPLSPYNSSITPSEIDVKLIEAIVQLRLCHDAGAIAQIKQAAAVSVASHRAGMAATLPAQREAQIRAAMEQVILSHNMSCAYSSIVTVHGEVLHNDVHHHKMQAGDLLLADVGAESELGWASDITRTWPVSGRFSPTQRAIYEVVLAAHDRCIEQVAPGVEYRDIHLLAARTIAEGLVDLGILKGQPEDLVAMDAHALFFPHGIGHLLGLDVHDMEDLGDLAGYAPRRVRSDRFGLCYLRLDRPLQTGMVVTVEPGFYQVSAILQNPINREKYQFVVNWDRLAKFADVRGIRIEDDVLVTESGYEVLTGNLPTQVAEIEALVR
jgi:Xaa-Pro aminopeptidase